MLMRVGARACISLFRKKLWSATTSTFPTTSEHRARLRKTTCQDPRPTKSRSLLKKVPRCSKHTDRFFQRRKEWPLSVSSIQSSFVIGDQLIWERHYFWPDLITIWIRFLGNICERKKSIPGVGLYKTTDLFKKLATPVTSLKVRRHWIWIIFDS